MHNFRPNFQCGRRTLSFRNQRVPTNSKETFFQARRKFFRLICDSNSTRVCLRLFGAPVVYLRCTCSWCTRRLLYDPFTSNVSFATVWCTRPLINSHHHGGFTPGGSSTISGQSFHSFHGQPNTRQ